MRCRVFWSISVPALERESSWFPPVRSWAPESCGVLHGCVPALEGETVTVVSALREVCARAKLCFVPKCSRGGKRVAVVSALREVVARAVSCLVNKCYRAGERVTVVSARQELGARVVWCFAWLCSRAGERDSDRGFCRSGDLRPCEVVSFLRVPAVERE